MMASGDKQAAGVMSLVHGCRASCFSGMAMRGEIKAAKIGGVGGRGVTQRGG